MAETATSPRSPDTLKCQSCGQDESFVGTGNLPIWQTIMCNDGEVSDYDSWDYSEGPFYDMIHCQVCEHLVWEKAAPADTVQLTTEALLLELVAASRSTVGDYRIHRAARKHMRALGYAPGGGKRA